MCGLRFFSVMVLSCPLKLPFTKMWSSSLFPATLLDFASLSQGCLSLKRGRFRDLLSGLLWSNFVALLVLAGLDFSRISSSHSQSFPNRFLDHVNESLFCTYLGIIQVSSVIYCLGRISDT